LLVWGCGAGGGVVQPGSVDLTSIVQPALDTVRDTAAARRITFETCLPAGSTVIAGDGGRLQQVVGNLLENAIKFSRDGVAFGGA
jgi:signal transduction histidine kinase